MAFYGYEGDFEGRYWTPHSSAYQYDYSSPYGLGEPNLVDYSSSEPINHTCSYNYYDYYANPSETSYSEPKFLQYDQVYFPSSTKFTISYSKAELNEPEFQEYDPTPYDGGYDQTMTYGEPLPPSDLTCYPRSLPKSDTPPLDNFSYHSTPSPYGKHDPLPLPLPVNPPNGSKTETESHSLPLPINPPNGSKPTDAKTETESHVEIVDVIPSHEHQNGHQIPYGSGLEAMDICESIFGYWPCLAKKAQQQMNHCQVCDQDRRMDPWKAAADYFFGSPVPYDYDIYHHHQSPYRSDQISWLQ